MEPSTHGFSDLLHASVNNWKYDRSRVRHKFSFGWSLLELDGVNFSRIQACSPMHTHRFLDAHSGMMGDYVPSVISVG